MKYQESWTHLQQPTQRTVADFHSIHFFIGIMSNQYGYKSSERIIMKPQLMRIKFIYHGTVCVYKNNIRWDISIIIQSR